MSAWPAADEERSFALRSRAREWAADTLITAEQREAIDARTSTVWHRNSLLLSAVFFVLTCVAMLAFYGLLAVFQLPNELLTGIVSIAVAEVLIQRKRFFGTGIESALWIGGLIALIASLPRSGRPEALLLFAVAFASVAWRVRNPLFGAMAAILVTVYAGVKTDGAAAPLMVGVIATVTALAALTRRWRLPSVEMQWQALVIVMPLGGYATAKVTGGETSFELIVFAAMAALTSVLIGVGVVKRDRVILAAGALSAAAALFEAHDLVPWPVEAKLIAAGSLLIAICATLARLLRSRASGLVVTPRTTTAYGEAIQIAGAISVARATEATPEASTRESGGGSFGGAGATGEF